MDVKVTTTGGVTFRPRLTDEPVYTESVSSCGPESATIPCVLDADRRTGLLGAEVVISGGGGVAWFGRVNDYKPGSLLCEGYHARYSDVPRPLDYVNSKCTGFVMGSDSYYRSSVSSGIEPSINEDGQLVFRFPSGQAIATGAWNLAYWYPRFRSIRGTATPSYFQATYHRSSVAYMRIRVLPCDETGIKDATVLALIDSGTGASDGTITVDNSSHAGLGFLVEVIITTGYTPSSDHNVTLTIGISDVSPDITTPDANDHMTVIADEVVQDILGATGVPTGGRKDPLTDLMFEPDSTDAEKVAEIAKRTGLEFYWRKSAPDAAPTAYLSPRATTPLYYTDTTLPTVSADLADGALTDYYNALHIIGTRDLVRWVRWARPYKKKRVFQDRPYVWHYDDPTPASNPLTGTGINRTGVLNLTGYAADLTTTVAAWFADNGRRKISGTVTAAQFYDLTGNAVNPSAVRCNELIRLNTEEWGLVDCRIESVEHVGDGLAKVTVGKPAADFAGLLDRLQKG